MSLNGRETALVLAGLRLLQRYFATESELPPAIRDILVETDMENAPLTRIDRLCEKINIAGEDPDTERLLDALAKTYNCLNNWVEIQDKEDAREEDAEALKEAATLLRAAGRIEG